MQHRSVEDRDIPTICAFPQDAEELFYCFPRASYPLSESALSQAISQRSDSTVVEVDGRAVAFANFYRWAPGGTCCIGNVIVAPEARGLGVGAYLIRHMVDLTFEKHKAQEVLVSCFNRNVAGLLFYPRLGFEPCSVEPRTDFAGNHVALIHFKIRQKNKVTQ